MEKFTNFLKVVKLLGTNWDQNKLPLREPHKGDGHLLQQKREECSCPHLQKEIAIQKAFKSRIKHSYGKEIKKIYFACESLFTSMEEN